MTKRIAQNGESQNPDCHPYAPKICPICGKHFAPPEPSKWAYKTKRTSRGRDYIAFMCSYPCKNKWDEEHPKKHRGVYLDYIAGL